MPIFRLRKRVFSLIVGLTAVVSIGLFWLRVEYPYLLENPALLFSKQADETIIQSLPSVKNIDYRPLKSFLQTERWEDADQETGRVIAKAINPKYEDTWSLRASDRPRDIGNFPCTDLKTIDRLWGKFSNGRFGFSVQKRIVEDDRKLPSHKEIQTLCLEKCRQKTLKNEHCSESCFGNRIIQEISRIPDRLGRGRQVKLTASSQLPDGYYPSWGVYWKITFSDSYPYIYKEFAARTAKCGL